MIRKLEKDDCTGPIVEQLGSLTMSQLLYLERMIQREKTARQKDSFQKWLQILDNFIPGMENKGKRV